MQAIAELSARLAALELRVASILRPSRVAEIDTERHRVRLTLGPGSDGDEVLSPWLPYGQVAGQTRAHIPPSVGQQMLLVSPGGELGLGVAMPATWSDDTPSPSTAEDANVITIGDVEITLDGGAITIVAGGVTTTIDGAGLSVEGGALSVKGNGVLIEGGDVTHDGKNIGSDHKHGGVIPGGAKTGPPS